MLFKEIVSILRLVARVLFVIVGFQVIDILMVGTLVKNI